VTPPTVAVIGAGISGAACARVLYRHGVRVRVFDKGRGPGGRACTRRVSGFEFDHGAQYFTASDPVFERAVDDWRRRGLVAPWPTAVHRVRRGQHTSLGDQPRRFVAVPRMSALATALVEGLEVRQEVRVARTLQRAHGWECTSATDEPLGPYDAVVIATPAPQAVPLLRDAPALAARAAQVTMTPNWTLLLAFERPLPVAFDAAFAEESPLSWMARNSSKPGRPPAPETWVVHASAGWSADHLELEPAGATTLLLEAFHEALGGEAPRPQWQTVHRWRYARAADNGSGPNSLYDPESRVGVCGDWLATARVEGAFLSGAGLAEHMLRDLGITPRRAAGPATTASLWS
jgi:predicted NAD/FAD-dependent oxidoreductase